MHAPNETTEHTPKSMFIFPFLGAGGRGEDEFFFLVFPSCSPDVPNDVP
jgi:hypothetical protein